MRLSNRTTFLSLLATIASAAWLILSGCDRVAPTPGPTPPATTPMMSPPGGGAAGPVDETGPFAAGKKIFASSGCGRCHRINGAPGPGGGGPMPSMSPPGGGGPGGPGPAGPGPGGPGGRGPGGPGGRAPDLGKIGDDPEHTVEWLAAFIRDPKSKKPDARMPPFPAQRINDEGLQALAEYLASLKSGPEKAPGEEPKGG